MPQSQCLWDTLPWDGPAGAALPTLRCSMASVCPEEDDDSQAGMHIWAASEYLGSENCGICSESSEPLHEMLSAFESTLITVGKVTFKK